MVFDYNRIQAIASAALANFNQGIIQLVKTATPIAGANEWDLPTDGVETIHDLDAVCEGVNKQYIDNDLVLASDLQVTCAVFQHTPELGDKVIVDGKNYTIIKIMGIPSAGVTCAWELIIR